MKTKLWDVVIVEMATGKVCSVVGKDLPKHGSFHTVDKRIETVVSRINLDAFFVKAVPAGSCNKGDVAP